MLLRTAILLWLAAANAYQCPANSHKVYEPEYFGGNYFTFGL
jgi:hypothetical protein